MIDGIRAIDGSQTLTEALEMVLRHVSSIAPRAAVFLINGPRLRSWKTAGFPQFDAQPFDSAITGSGLLAQAIQSAEPTFSGPSQPPPTFASLSGDLSALVVPVILSGRAVALVYADNAGKNDIAASWRDGVETLVRHASAHLALLTAMRTVQAMGASAPVGTGGAVRPESDTSDQSARRYARLLVSEIKLYNEAAVRAGREQRDLLRRLRPEIDRARRLYEERISAGLGARGAVLPAGTRANPRGRRSRSARQFLMFSSARSRSIFIACCAVGLQLPVAGIQSPGAAAQAPGADSRPAADTQLAPTTLAALPQEVDDYWLVPSVRDRKAGTTTALATAGKAYAAGDYAAALTSAQHAATGKSALADYGLTTRASRCFVSRVRRRLRKRSTR